MALLYVTSFSKKLYEYSGKTLIESYIKNNITDPLLVCTDDFEYSSPSENIISKYIGDDSYLQQWEKNNEDIIPEKYGGKCKSKYKILMHNVKKYKSSKNATDEMKETSRHNFMNYRVKNFFMKIVSLNFALKTYRELYDIIIWIDCDCYFEKSIDSMYINNIFNDKYGVIYFEGEGRKSVNNGYETGFIGFNKKHKGYELLLRIIDSYKDGSFRKYKGWYDGFIIKMVCEESDDITKYDMTYQSNSSNVMNCDNPIFDYIKHKKGTHHVKEFNITKCKRT